MVPTEDITEAAGILSILDIRERIRIISTADGAGIRKLVITGVRGAVMRPAAIPGPRAAAEGRVGAAARRLAAPLRYHTWERQSTVVALHTVAVALMQAVGSMAAASIVDGRASLEMSAYRDLPQYRE